MATCAHEHLRLEEATRYRCATCGLPFVVLSVEQPPEAPAVEPTPKPDEIDVSGQVRRHVPSERRLPSNIRR